MDCFFFSKFVVFSYRSELNIEVMYVPFGWISGPVILDETALNVDPEKPIKKVSGRKAAQKKLENDAFSFVITIPLLSKDWAKTVDKNAWHAIDTWNSAYLRRHADDKQYKERSKTITSWLKAVMGTGGG